MGEQRCSCTQFGLSVDLLVPYKPSCSLTEATVIKIQFYIFRKDKVLCVRQKDEKGIFSVAP